MPVGLLPRMWVPDLWLDQGAPAFGSALLIDATGEKAAMCGRVYIPGGGTKNINAVGFRFGAVTNPALTTLTLSLQDVSLTTGMPDEVQDQSVTIPNANIVANTWLLPALGTNRTVTHGDRLAIVWEFLNFVATASVVINTLAAQGTPNQECYPALKSAAGPTWAFIVAAASIIPNVVLGFDDGTFGTLEGARGQTIAGTAVALSTGSANLEHANGFVTAVPGIMEAVWLFVDMDGDLDLNIYEATPTDSAETLLVGPIHLDKDVRCQTTARLVVVPISPTINMKPGWIYRVAWNGPTATASTLYAQQYSNLTHQAAFGPATGTYDHWSRAAVGTGAWTDVSVAGNGPLLCGIRLYGVRYPVRSAGLVT